MKIANIHIRVCLANEQTNLMKEIAFRLQGEKDIAFIHLKNEGMHLIDIVQAHFPKIILFDIDSDGHCGPDLFEEFQQINEEDVRFIALSNKDDMENIGSFFSRGGWGYELKNCNLNEIAIAIMRVFNGKHFICSSIAGESIYTCLQANPPIKRECLEKLTSTERDVLAILKKTGGSKNVSMLLGISVGTAEKHIEHILRKVDATSQTELRSRLAFTSLE
jgi:DNA-binding NarL/FixJ family response regulator